MTVLPFANAARPIVKRLSGVLGLTFAIFSTSTAWAAKNPFLPFDGKYQVELEGCTLDGRPMNDIPRERDITEVEFHRSRLNCQDGERRSSLVFNELIHSRHGGGTGAIVHTGMDDTQARDQCPEDDRVLPPLQVSAPNPQSAQVVSHQKPLFESGPVRPGSDSRTLISSTGSIRTTRTMTMGEGGSVNYEVEVYDNFHPIYRTVSHCRGHCSSIGGPTVSLEERKPSLETVRCKYVLTPSVGE